MKNYLLNNFNHNNKFLNALNNGEKNIHSFRVENNYGLDLVCNFPGYKSERRGNKIIYDYRIDYNGIAISHVNIIVDIYNKVQQHPEIADLFIQFLNNLARYGDQYNRELFLQLHNYRFNAPTQEILNYVTQIHNNLNKYYQKIGNSWNYSIDELAHMIMWIVIQEDINYPMPRFLGRRMSFYRYLEAIYVGHNEVYSLKDVITAALSHNLIKDRWNQVDYSHIRSLKQ